MYKNGMFGGASDPSFFDLYGTPLFAYSLRDLRGDNPTVVTLRRSSDNAEQSFTASQVQSGTPLTDFSGANDLRVKIWHSQVNGVGDVTSPTQSDEPYLVRNGVIESFNGNTSIRFRPVTSSNIVLPASYKDVAHNVYRIHFAQTRDYAYPDDSNIGNSNSGYTADDGNASTFLFFNYGLPQLYVNGILETPSTRSEVFTAFGGTTTPVQISIRGENVGTWVGDVRIGKSNVGGLFNGFIPEMVMYPSDVINQDIVQNQIDFYSIT